MASHKWNAYKALNIIERGSREMKCVGKTIRHQDRCRYPIPARDILEIHAILKSMEMEHPEKAMRHLPRLAHFGLCIEYHKSSQAVTKIKEWRSTLSVLAVEFDEINELRAQVKRQKLSSAKYDNECSDVLEVIKDLEIQQHAKDEEIEKRSKKIQELTTEMSVIASKHDKKISTLEWELLCSKTYSEANSADQKRVITGLQNSLDGERQKLTETSICLEKSRLDHQKVQGDLAREMQRSNDLSTQMDMLTDKLASTRNAFEISHLGLESKDCDVERLKGELANANASLGLAQAEVDILRTTATILGLELEIANETLTNEQLDAESLRDQVALLEDRLGDANDALTSSQQATDHAYERAQKVEGELHTVNGKLAKGQSVIASLQNQANNLTKDLNASQIILHQTQNEAEGLRNQVSALTSGLAGANNMLASTQMAFEEEHKNYKTMALAAVAREEVILEEQRRLILRINKLQLGMSGRLVIWLMAGFRGIMRRVLNCVWVKPMAKARARVVYVARTG